MKFFIDKTVQDIPSLSLPIYQDTIYQDTRNLDLPEQNIDKTKSIAVDILLTKDCEVDNLQKQFSKISFDEHYVWNALTFASHFLDPSAIHNVLLVSRNIRKCILQDLPDWQMPQLVRKLPNLLLSEYIPLDVFNNYTVLLEAVKINPLLCLSAGQEIRQNDQQFKELLTAAVTALIKNSGKVTEEAREQIIELAKSVLTTIKPIAMKLVTKKGTLLRYVGKEMQDDEDVVHQAVKTSALALEHASDRLKNNEEIVTEAVSNNGVTLLYAGDEMKNRETVVSIAISTNSLSINYASDTMKNNANIQKILSQQNIPRINRINM